jgi:hypothetical protein
MAPLLLWQQSAISYNLPHNFKIPVYSYSVPLNFTTIDVPYNLLWHPLYCSDKPLTTWKSSRLLRQNPAHFANKPAYSDNPHAFSDNPHAFSDNPHAFSDTPLPNLTTLPPTLTTPRHLWQPPAISDNPPPSLTTPPPSLTTPVSTHNTNNEWFYWFTKGGENGSRGPRRAVGKVGRR